MRLLSSPRALLGAFGAVLLVVLIASPLTPAEPAPTRAQDQPAAAEAEVPTFPVGTAQVVLDVVVRDKKGRPVLDVRPEELEVVEAGDSGSGRRTPSSTRASSPTPSSRCSVWIRA